MSAPEPLRLPRREAIKWMFAAAASTLLLDPRSRGVDFSPRGDTPGYGDDPDLLKDYEPGDLWPLTFTPEQRRAATALCDVILPADATSPSASAVGVPDFIDEWISAPYPAHKTDRAKLTAGLAWIDAEAKKRFGSDFASLIYRQQTAICDDICHEPSATDEFKTAARFFSRFRNLTTGGFYTTSEGMKDLKFMGNTPSATFDGPSDEILRRLGIEP